MEVTQLQVEIYGNPFIQCPALYIQELSSLLTQWNMMLMYMNINKAAGRLLEGNNYEEHLMTGSGLYHG